MPKVSVVVPNYNYGRFLERRLQSIMNQTFQDFEIIYLDDASTDDSDEVFAKFAGDPRIRSIHNQVNSGSPFKQWNKGIRHAKGEYVWFAEADDYADTHLLATLVDRLDRYPGAGIAYCQSLVVDANGAVLDSGQHLYTQVFGSKRWCQDFVNNGREECRRFLFASNTIPNASAALVRKVQYEQAGGADTTFKLCGDWMLWTRLLLISDICFVAEPLNYWREHEQSIRTSQRRDGLDLIESYRVMSFIMQNLQVPESTYERGCNYFARRWLAHALRRRLRLSRNIAVYRSARQVDPRVVRRFPGTLAEYVKEQIDRSGRLSATHTM